jgi:hypothetical protein
MEPDTVELEIDTRALDAALKDLPTRVAGNAMKKALQAAGDVLLAAIVAHTPERTDEEVPASAGSWFGSSGSGSTSLPPGILKADMHTEVQMGKGSQPPRVKVGPTSIAAHVARWQNNGWNLTKGGKRRKDRNGNFRGSGKVIRAIPGKHFMEAGFDESSEAALETFLAALAQGITTAAAAAEKPEED